MVVQVRDLSKGFPAVLAHKGPFVAMYPFMVAKVGCLCESLLAVIAGELLVHCMVFNMRDQGGLFSKDFATEGAWSIGAEGFVLEGEKRGLLLGVR